MSEEKIGGKSETKRFLIMTVGKTHSGKSTFARELEVQLPGALIIDQDNHAEFVNTYYRKLLPKSGPNEIKYAISQTIVEYAVERTSYHLILCNSNRGIKERIKAIQRFQSRGFVCILVYFNLPNTVLEERVVKSQRSTAIFRSAASFEEVLKRQQEEESKGAIQTPTADEADHFFTIKGQEDVQTVIQAILGLSPK